MTSGGPQGFPPTGGCGVGAAGASQAPPHSRHLSWRLHEFPDKQGRGDCLWTPRGPGERRELGRSGVLAWSRAPVLTGRGRSELPPGPFSVHRGEGSRWEPGSRPCLRGGVNGRVFKGPAERPGTASNAPGVWLLLPLCPPPRQPPRVSAQGSPHTPTCLLKCLILKKHR